MSPVPSIHTKISLAFGAIVFALGLTACGQRVDPPAERTSVLARMEYRRPNPEAALVFRSSSVEQGLAVRGASEDRLARNDRALSLRTRSLPTAADEWPEPDRPDLRDRHYLYLPTYTHSGRYVFFDSHRRYERRHNRR